MKFTRQGVRDLNLKPVNGHAFPKKKVARGAPDRCPHAFAVPIQGKKWGVGMFGEPEEHTIYGKQCAWCGEERWHD